MTRIATLITQLLFLVFLSLVHADESYYELLGLTQDAEQGEIKRAFRKLSVKYHPDKNPGDEEAAEMFRKINRASEVLQDPDLRQIYDQGGEDAVQKFERGEGMQQKGPDAKAEMMITLEEFYNGVDKDITIQRNIVCKQCKGTGAKDGKTKTCPECKGQGVSLQAVNMGGFNMQMQV